MIFSLIKAFLLGICAAVPIGPVMLFVLQKTLNHGKRAGVVSGVGSACMDTVYAALSICILSVAEEFLKRNEVIIAFAGGAIITFVGVMSLVRNPFGRKDSSGPDRTLSAGYAAQTFLLAASNPAALFVMFALMSAMGIEAEGWWKVPVLCMIFCGELFYWTVFSYIFSIIGHKVNYTVLKIVGKVTAVAIIIFGVVLVGDGVIKL